MPISYIGTTNSFNHTITIPQDGIDQVNQTSVNSGGFELLANQTHYLTKSLTGYRPHISLVWNDTGSILVSPFNRNSVSSSTVSETWWAVENPPTTGDPWSPFTKIDSSFLEPAGSFAVSTTYFIYMKVVVLPGNITVRNIIISTNVPDTTLSFKTTMGVSDITYRYLGHFITDSSANIIPFVMNDFRYEFGTSIAMGPGTITTTGSFQGFFIPVSFPSAQIKKATIQFEVAADAVGVSSVDIKPTSWPSTSFQTFRWRGNGPSTDYRNFITTLPVPVSPLFSVRQNPAAGFTSATFTPYLIGYEE